MPRLSKKQRGKKPRKDQRQKQVKQQLEEGESSIKEDKSVEDVATIPHENVNQGEVEGDVENVNQGEVKGDVGNVNQGEVKGDVQRKFTYSTMMQTLISCWKM